MPCIVIDFNFNIIHLISSIIMDFPYEPKIIFIIPVILIINIIIIIVIIIIIIIIIHFHSNHIVSIQLHLDFNRQVIIHLH